MAMPKGWKFTDNDFEDKKWKVERIDKFLRSQHEEWSNSKVYFVTKYTEAYPKRYNQKRNQIVTIRGYAVSLFATMVGLLISVKDFSFITPLIIVVIVISVPAFIIIIILTELSKRFSEGMNQVKESYLSRATGLYIIEGSLSVRSLDLKSLSIRQLDVLFNFLMIFASDKAELNEALNNFLANHFIHSDHKDELKSEVAFNEEMTKAAYGLFEKYAERFDKEKDFLKGIFWLITPLIQKYRPAGGVK